MQLQSKSSNNPIKMTNMEYIVVFKLFYGNFALKLGLFETLVTSALNKSIGPLFYCYKNS